jgi:SAM-dependent methyltransferase
MVHALNEIHRVLAPDGILIDLRPLLDRWPLEVVSSGKVQEAGRVTDLVEPLSDDQAADQAVAEIGKRGWFVRKREETFPFFYYWDTPKEMQEYISETWYDVINIDDKLWNDLRSLWAISNTDARVRIRLKMLIVRWKKT